MSFPIAVHSETNYNKQPYHEGPALIDVTVEIGSNVLDLATRVLARMGATSKGGERKPTGVSSARASMRQANIEQKGGVAVADYKTDIALAGDPQTDSDTLAQLVATGDAMVKSEVIFNPSTPIFLIKLLTRDEDRFIASQAKVRFAQSA